MPKPEYQPRKSSSAASKWLEKFNARKEAQQAQKGFVSSEMLLSDGIETLLELCSVASLGVMLGFNTSLRYNIIVYVEGERMNWTEGAENAQQAISDACDFIMDYAKEKFPRRFELWVAARSGANLKDS